MKQSRTMGVETGMVVGWSRFGIGYIRLFPTERNHYTIWLLCLTKRISLGIHVNIK
jgi:hypothetical protein